MDRGTKEIIERLINKTKQNKVIWNKASRAEEFSLVLDSGVIILVDNWYSEGDTYYDITINNDKGITILNHVLNKEDEEANNYDYHLLKQLHQAIKDNYYNVDETIKGIIKEIQNKEFIGSYSIDDDDDDVPF